MPLTAMDYHIHRTGVYYATSGILAVAAGADAATVFKFSLQVPGSNPVAVRVREIAFASWTTTALATITAPRITVERATFATVAAQTVTPAKRVRTAIGGNLADAANTARPTTTAPTTPVAGEAVHAFTVVNNETAVGAVSNIEANWVMGDYGLVLAPLEALVIRQADAGTTSDTRKFSVDFLWEEYTLV